ncbi:MAG TPA: hypothetical protein VI072_29460 [Polyangiaceae bacterium]
MVSHVESGDWLLRAVINDCAWTVLFGYEAHGLVGFMVFREAEEGGATVNVWWSTIFERFEATSRADVPDVVQNLVRVWAAGSSPSKWASLPS